MAKPKNEKLPEIARMVGLQALFGAAIGFVFGVALLVFNVANMGQLFMNTDVKLIVGLIYFTSLMTTFALGSVATFALEMGEHE